MLKLIEIYVKFWVVVLGMFGLMFLLPGLLLDSLTSE